MTTQTTAARHDRESAPATARRPRTAPGAARGMPNELVHGALGRPSHDELAQQDICAALLSTPGLDARHIEVEMTGTCVLLRGSVDCPDDRERALAVARRIAAPRPTREVLTVLQRTTAQGAAPGAARFPETDAG